MKWDFSKKTKDRSKTELEFQETFEYVRELEEKLAKIEAVVDDLYFKAQVIHGFANNYGTSEE